MDTTAVTPDVPLMDVATPSSTATIPSVAPEPTAAQATPPVSDNQAQPAPAPRGSMLKGILAGALSGMAGSAGQRTFGGGLAAGAAGAMQEQWRQKEFTEQQKSNASRIRFQDASAAQLTAHAAYMEQQRQYLPQEMADKHAAADMETLKSLIALGAPIVAAENSHEGAITGLQQAAANNKEVPGTVPALLHFNLGDRVVGVPMSFFAKSADARYAALGKINYMRSMEGGSPLTIADLNGMGKEAFEQLVNEGYTFDTPHYDPKAPNIHRYQNILESAKLRGDGDSVRWAQTRINNLTREKTAFDSTIRNAAMNPLQESEAQQHRAEAAKARSEAAFSTADKTDAFGDNYAGGLGKKEFLKRYDTFTKDNVSSLRRLEKTNDEFQSILSSKTMTGAQKVTALLSAVGISGDPLQGKGFRINNDIISEHAAARPIIEDAVQKANRLIGTGGPITESQVRDYASIASAVRHDAYLSAAGEARRQGIPVDFMPRGNNRPMDADTAKLFLASAGSKDANDR